MRLGHLNLTVADREVAVAFYGRWFGFDRVLAEYDDGTTFVTDAGGFELVLHQGTSQDTTEDWHFGFLASSATEVTDLASRMRAAGQEVDAVEEDAGYCGFKCRDPDGHEIEVYFEPRPVSAG